MSNNNNFYTLSPDQRSILDMYVSLYNQNNQQLTTMQETQQRIFHNINHILSFQTANTFNANTFNETNQHNVSSYYNTSAGRFIYYPNANPRQNQRQNQRQKQAQQPKPIKPRKQTAKEEILQSKKQALLNLGPSNTKGWWARIKSIFRPQQQTEINKAHKEDPTNGANRYIANLQAQYDKDLTDETKRANEEHIKKIADNQKLANQILTVKAKKIVRSNNIAAKVKEIENRDGPRNLSTEQNAKELRKQAKEELAENKAIQKEKRKEFKEEQIQIYENQIEHRKAFKALSGLKKSDPEFTEKFQEYLKKQNEYLTKQRQIANLEGGSYIKLTKKQKIQKQLKKTKKIKKNSKKSLLNTKKYRYHHKYYNH